MSVIAQFLQSAQNHLERPAVTDSSGEWTYQQLVGVTRRVATILDGLTDNKHMGLLLPTCRAFAATHLASLMCGKVVVPINFLLEDEQLKYICEDASLDTIITCGPLREKAEATGAKNVILFEEMDIPAATPYEGVHPWADDDLATILYTSGTTGNPKGVMLTHGNFTSNVASCQSAIDLTKDDVMIGLLPLFHSFGITATFLVPLLTGAKAVFVEKFQPGRVAELIEMHGVSLLFAIPSMYRFLVRMMEKHSEGFSSLRFCVSGGEPLEDALFDSFFKVIGLPLLNGYGLTETSPVAAINRPEDPRRGSIGPPIHGTEAKVVDNAGATLTPGCEGELWLRGPNIMKGYYKLPKETADVLTSDGWFKTGDLARTDKDNFMYITGRKKDLIKSSGEYISPFEIETVISAHPAVFEVAVIGIPDETRGEMPKAFVVLKPETECTDRELKALCQESLAKFKCPKEIEFRKELPHGPTGKILKRVLKKELGMG
ncbi:MAG: AMP-binding protein [Planctomycetota bacterium]|nr:AMP-binding protein [Planctomycetota bacterium]MDA1137633.1 AMP-binding protein [Planctomycetota bacterium]